MDPPSDAELIERSDADPAVFAVIFDRHAARILAYAIRRVGRSDAEDLLAEAFRIAFETRRRFDTTRASALPWLYGIVANLCRKRQRGLVRGDAAVRRFGIVGNGRTDVPFDDVIVDHAANRDLLDAVRALIDDLPPGERDAVVLYAWEGLSYHQIAEALDLPVGTVRSRLNRVRGQLRELRDGFGEEVGVNPQRAPGGV